MTPAGTSAGPQLRTERLLLRRWTAADRAPFAAMNADPRVMEHFPDVLSRAESDALVERIEQGFEHRGFGLWAVEVLARPDGESAGFIGFVGLAVPGFALPGFPAGTPPVEIGWRLAATAWGRGYATEAARAALGFGFEIARVPEIVSFTSTSNLASQRVMQRLGMTRDPADDFDHPMLPPGHRLRRHVLYRCDREAWSRRPTDRA